MPRRPSSLPLFEPADRTYPVITCFDFDTLPSGNLSSTTNQIPFLDTHEEIKAVDYVDPFSLEPMADETVLIDRVNDSVIHGDHSGSERQEKRPAYNPLPNWLAHRETFLLELLRRDGRGDFIGQGCSRCQDPDSPALYRCTICTSGAMYCQACIVEIHTYNLLHIIEKWTDDSVFDRITLKSLGLKVHLGHHPGGTCLNPKRPHKDGFVVLDLNGIQEVDLNFCGCLNAKPHFVQILRYGWYPASTERPQTAATNQLLKFFQILNFESKASLFEFYNTLSRLTDNTGTAPPKDRYPALLIMPGINMSPGWETAPLELQFLHCLFLAIDANFRLKRRNVSSEVKDPSLSDGWLYFVPQTPYKAHIDEFGDVIEQKKSTCSNHQAVNAERSAKGYAISGVLAVDCARHDMKRPLAVGDLQKGERYVNTDFMFFSGLQSHQLSNVVVSYDICCQWSKNLWTRMDQYPLSMAIPEDAKSCFRFLVPKFHLPAHIAECQTKYSFNFAPFVGRTDGEAPERGWAKINPLAPSTSEMGPGNRRDTLNDIFMDNNWWKSANMAAALADKRKEAKEAADDYSFLHHQFTLGLPPDQVKGWEKALKAWERDPDNQPNPFEKRFEIITFEKVKKRLNNQEESSRTAEAGYVLHETVSAVKLITMGLDLEEQQRKLSRRTSKRDDTYKAADGSDISSYETSIVHNLMEALQRKIQSFITIQHLYVPALHAIRACDAESSPQLDLPATTIKLYLPSDPVCIAQATASQTDRPLVTIEYQLRCAQAEDALNELRNALRLRSYLFIDKDRFQRGQRRSTRSRTIISRLEEKVSSAAAKYRAARNAISRLAPILSVVWSTTFPALNDGDIRSFNDDDLPIHMKPALNLVQRKELLKRTSKKARKLGSQPPSWIWQRLGAHCLDDDALEEDLRIEYCKSHARAARWKEEAMILEEEMRRVKNFFRYRSSTWLQLAHEVDISAVLHNSDGAIQEGRRAYAIRQSRMFTSMVGHCEKLWNPSSSDDANSK